MPAHRCSFRVYYEDTDAGGVMYHARYLAFAERARSEALRDAGLSAAVLAASDNIHFAVSRIEIDYRRPFRLDDLVTVETALLERRAASFRVRQTLSAVPAGPCAVMDVTLAAVRMPDGRPTRLPHPWPTILDGLSAPAIPEA